MLSTLQGWDKGFNSPFRSEVYFINTRPVTDLRWGTPAPITIRDPDFGMVQVRANGLCVIKIDDVDVFLREVIGTDSAVESDEIAELLRRIIATAFCEMVLETGVGAIDLQGRQVELAGKLRDYVQEKVDDEYGLHVADVTMTLSLPDEITTGDDPRCRARRRGGRLRPQRRRRRPAAAGPRRRRDARRRLQRGRGRRRAGDGPGHGDGDGPDRWRAQFAGAAGAGPPRRRRWPARSSTSTRVAGRPGRTASPRSRPGSPRAR